MNRTKIIDIAVAVIAAVCLWAYVINIVNPPTTQTFRGIPVDLVGEEVMSYNHLAISGESKYTVDVVLAGSRLDLNGVTEDDISAHADLSALKIGQNYITVEASCPDTVKINEIRSQKIQVYAEELVVQDKPLNISFVQDMEGYEPTIIKSDSDVVAVSGAKSLVDMVNEVSVDIDVTQLAIDASSNLTLQGAPLDAYGKLVDGVNISKDIDVSAVLYAVKTVPLNIKVTGYPGYHASVRNKEFPQEVTIKGMGKRLSKVEFIEVPEINISGITTDKEYVLEPILPLGIYLSDNSPELVGNVTLVNAGSNSFEYDLSELTIVGLASDKYCRILSEEKISVTAKATLDMIKKLKAAEVAPCIDITGLENGTYSISIGSLHGDGGITYEFAPSVLDVVIGDRVITGYDEFGDAIYEELENEQTEQENTAAE